MRVFVFNLWRLIIARYGPLIQNIFFNQITIPSVKGADSFENEPFFIVFLPLLTPFSIFLLRRTTGNFTKIIRKNIICLYVGEANNLWKCKNCGCLFGYPKFDPNSRKDRCPACGSSDITRSKILKR